MSEGQPLGPVLQVATTPHLCSVCATTAAAALGSPATLSPPSSPSVEGDGPPFPREFSAETPSEETLSHLSTDDSADFDEFGTRIRNFSD